MLKFEEMKEKVFCSGTVPDGYFGERASVGFAFHKGCTFTVTDTGYFNAGIPQALTVEEARWLLDRHPTARNITVTSKGIYPAHGNCKSVHNGYCYTCQEWLD